MVTKNQKKVIKSLHQKKYRKVYGIFVAEGIKLINELITSKIKVNNIYTVDPDAFHLSDNLCTLVKENELKQLSFLNTPQKALGVFYIPKEVNITLDHLILSLDDVRDPGNLGTIIRLCDWFGIQHLVCSENTVDCYNPKVVQASMGSISRVYIHYVNLEKFLESIPIDLPVFGTFLEGNIIYKQNTPTKGIIVMGNEANGISPKISKYITHKITIPSFSLHQKTESLNVATATAITLSEFMRSQMK